MVKTGFNIRTQLLLLLGLTAIGMVSIAALLLNESHQSLKRIEHNKLQRLSISATEIVKTYHKQVETGALDERTARARALETIRSIHYKGHLHYWVYSLDGHIILDVLYPQHEGKRIEKTKFSKNLKSYLQGKEVKKISEGRFIKYNYDKFGEVQKNLSYIKIFTPWNWVIITANSQEEIDRILYIKLLKAFGIIALILFVVIVLSLLLIRNIVKPLERIKNSILQLSKGNFQVKIPDLKVENEIGDIARTLEEFRKASNDIASLKQSKQEIVNQLRTDALTGLANRKAIDEIAEALGPRRRAEDLKTSFALVDLNKFKPINDTFGHKAGDETLTSVAEWLREAAEPNDIVARLGGDEFGIVMTNVDSYEELKQYGQRIVDQFGKSIFFENNEIMVSASVGIAYGPDVEGKFQELMSAADKAMYSIKSLNKSAFAIYNTNMLTRKSDLKAKQEFLAALSNKQIVPYFQPKIDLNNGNTVGFEALARWEHPEQGILTPGTFFNLIEEYSLHHKFNDTIIRQVMEQIYTWQEEGYEPMPVSINVDEQTLATRAGLANMEAIFDEYSDILEFVSIEITEDVFVARAADAIRDSIETLNDRGIKISMDDFGTGYGSFKHLQEFPFDELKIDMEFTAGIGRDRSSEVIIDGFLSIAEGLGAIVVAEGIETAEQAEYLRLRGCHYGQGYLYGKSIDAANAKQFLKNKAEDKVVNI